MQSRSRCGKQQQDGLHGLQERAAILDHELSPAPVKNISTYSVSFRVFLPWEVILEAQLETQQFLTYRSSSN